MAELELGDTQSCPLKYRSSASGFGTLSLEGPESKVGAGAIWPHWKALNSPPPGDTLSTPTVRGNPLEERRADCTASAQQHRESPHKEWQERGRHGDEGSPTPNATNCGREGQY